MSRVPMYRNTTAHPNLTATRPKSQKKVVHFDDSANKEFILPPTDGDDGNDDYEIDRAFERSLASGHMSDAELNEEVLKMCGWYEGIPEVMPPMANANSLSDGTSGVFTWDDLDTTPSSSSHSSKSRISRKFSTRQPSVSSLFDDLHVSAGLSYHPYNKVHKKKSTLLKCESVSLSAAPKNSSVKAEDFDDVLEDAFRGIVHEDNDEVVVERESSEAAMEEESPEESPNGDYWDDVEF